MFTSLDKINPEILDYTIPKLIKVIFCRIEEILDVRLFFRESTAHMQGNS